MSNHELLGTRYVERPVLGGVFLMLTVADTSLLSEFSTTRNHFPLSGALNSSVAFSISSSPVSLQNSFPISRLFKLSSSRRYKLTLPFAVTSQVIDFPCSN